MRKFRNVTKRVAAFGLCGIMALGLTACGAKASNDMAYDGMEYYSTSSSTGAWNGSASYDKAVTEESEAEYKYSVSDSVVTQNAASSSGNSETGLVETMERKVIKTANLNLQTLDFDGFASALDVKIAESDAYLQYADVSGTDYYGGRKSANYTVRVPEANFNLFLSGLEGIATVVNKTLGEQDVTLSYVDTEARIKTLEIEQERLYALLEKADTLDAIITLEQRLSEVRYEIESYKTKLRNYDDKITYSTVKIYVYEVTKVTEKEPETLLERISNGWAETMEDISKSAQNFVVWLVMNLPYLVFWGVVIVVLVVVLKKKRAKRRAKKLGKQSENNETVLDSQE